MSSDSTTTDASPPRTSYAVLDLDGVVADVRHRLHHLEKKPKDWNRFFAAASEDPPLAQGVELAQLLAAEHELVYLTGRPSKLRRVTEAWLKRHDLPLGRLIMRSSGDYRPARLAKVELLRQLEEQHPVHIVVDDDAAVVAAAQQAGFAVLHATWAEPRATLHQAQEGDGRT
jgi:phosphoglycolate phosphatase-like HAD superfamily hydrolase